MNVQALKQMSAMPTVCATTLKDRTSVDVLVDIRVMAETAQVNISFIRSTGTQILCFFKDVEYSQLEVTLLC